MRIEYENDTDLAEFEAINKGYRNDIIVNIKGSRFRIYATTMRRLEQDFETEIKEYGFYEVEPNIVIVESATKESIESTIEYLFKCKYFEKLRGTGGRFPVPQRKQQMNHTTKARGANHSPCSKWDRGRFPVPLSVRRRE